MPHYLCGHTLYRRWSPGPDALSFCGEIISVDRKILTVRFGKRKPITMPFPPDGGPFDTTLFGFVLPYDSPKERERPIHPFRGPVRNSSNYALRPIGTIVSNRSKSAYQDLRYNPLSDCGLGIVVGCVMAQQQLINTSLKKVYNAEKCWHSVVRWVDHPRLRSGRQSECYELVNSAELSLEANTLDYAKKQFAEQQQRYREALVLRAEMLRDGKLCMSYCDSPGAACED